MNTKYFDTIIVGTGAAGSILAKELLAKKQNLLIIEQGNIPHPIGKLRHAINFYNFSKLLKLPKKSIEGIILYQAVLFGGTTVVSCGNATISLKDELFKIGVDIKDEIDEIKNEINVNLTDSKLFSGATEQIISGSSKLGLKMQSMPKFLDNKKCMRCGNCVLGCIYSAKWSGNKLLKPSESNILYNAKVTGATSVNGIATGVEYIINGKKYSAKAEKVVLSGGAISTPQILMNSGIDAGSNLSLDLFVNIYGYSDKFNQLNEPVMPVVSLDNFWGKGFLISPFINRSPFIRFIEGGISVASIPRKGLTGLMVKTKDDSNGTVFCDGSFSKPLTDGDRKRIDEGIGLSKEILHQIGIRNRDISISKIQGAHPAGTAAFGKIIDNSFQTKIKNLYVCDASVLPEAPGLPPILTIMALAKKLSKLLN